MTDRLTALIAAVLLAAVITGAVFLIRGCKKSDAADKDMEQVQDPADNSGGEGIVVDDALLTLVNPWNKLPEDWTVDLVTLSDGHKVDSRCYEALQEMMDACRAAGNSPLICAAYRTEETQQGLYDNKVQRLSSARHQRASAGAGTGHCGRQYAGADGGAGGHRDAEVAHGELLAVRVHPPLSQQRDGHHGHYL